MKPRLLDLYCKAGGAGKGYAEAGFEVVGVDHEPQPNYPFEFFQEDALRVLDHMARHWARQGEAWALGHRFDAIHASPPCQRSSAITRIRGNPQDHPELIPETRELLKATGLPYVIENVVRAPLINPITICGAAYCPTIVDEGEPFYIQRHRLFETNFPLMVAPCACSKDRGTVLGIYGGGTRQDTRKEANPNGGNTRKANKAQASALMGIDWMTRAELCQAIPPAYTAHVGSYLLSHLETNQKAAA